MAETKEKKPKGLCIFCNKGFYNEEGKVVGQVGNVKRPDHALEWFHMDCYEKWRKEVRTGRKVME